MYNISYYADICWLFTATPLIGFWKWLEPEIQKQQRRRLPVDPPPRCGDWCTFSCPRLGVWKDRGVIGKLSWGIEDISMIVIYCYWLLLMGSYPSLTLTLNFNMRICVHWSSHPKRVGWGSQGRKSKHVWSQYPETDDPLCKKRLYVENPLTSNKK